MPPTPSHCIKVFIVEDSSLFRDRLKRFLSDHPWIEVVGEAEDVPNTLAALEAVQPDVLLLDLGLPGQSGSTILGQLGPRFSATKVVVLTAQASSEVRQICLTRGADAVVDKGDTDACLLPILRRVTGIVEPGTAGGSP